MKGEAFDREFVNPMIRDHEKDIAEYKEQAKGESPVAKMAGQSVPVLEKRLRLAEGLKGQPWPSAAKWPELSATAADFRPEGR